MCATALRTCTPDQLLAMPDGEFYELVDANLVERKVGAESSHVAGRVFRLIDRYGEEPNGGWVLFPEGTSYRCFPGVPDDVRRPDVSFIRGGRFENDQLPETYLRIPPDLAVEVASPNDLVYEMDETVDEFLAAGVRPGWVMNPSTGTVRVHHRDRPGVLLTRRGQDELTGDDVLPGFRCRVAELFAAQRRAAERLT